MAYLRSSLTDDRVLTHLLVAYGLVMGLVLVSFLIRRLLGRGGERLATWTGQAWLADMGRDAAGRAQTVLARLTLLGVLGVALGMAAYHLAGRDVRQDVRRW